MTQRGWHSEKGQALGVWVLSSSAALVGVGIGTGCPTDPKAAAVAACEMALISSRAREKGRHKRGSLIGPHMMVLISPGGAAVRARALQLWLMCLPRAQAGRKTL